MTTPNELNKLKEVFKDRYLKQLLIDRSGEKRRNVNHVLNSRHKNQKVIDVAFSILEEQKKKISRRKILLQ